MTTAASQSLDQLAQSWSDQMAAMPGFPVDGAEPSDGPAWLEPVRRAAADAFRQKGLPGNRDEAWKYTSLRRLPSVAPCLKSVPVNESDGSAAWQSLLTEPTGFGFTIIDGRVTEVASTLPDGVALQTLEDALENPANSTIEERLKALVESIEYNGRSQAFEALNTALLGQGLVIHVAEGQDAGACVARWGQSSEARGHLGNVRIFLLLEKGAKLAYLEQYLGPVGDAAASAGESTGQATSVIIQAELGEQSELSHIRLVKQPEQDILLTFDRLAQQAGSHYSYTGFDLGGGLARHEITCSLKGAAAHASVNGAFVLDHEQHCDYHIRIDHEAGETTSDQFFRGVLGGASRGVFNGKAVIHPGADGSRVQQSNANLLLSDRAEIDTKPELEIYADEVEARHGATVGQLDERAIFYMRTRGIPEDEARRELTGAFCRMVADRVSEPSLAGQLADLLDESLPQTSFK